MSIQDWGAIGEIISRIGVVATLIYLTIQIRASTAAPQGSTGSSEMQETLWTCLLKMGERGTVPERIKWFWFFGWRRTRNVHKSDRNTIFSLVRRLFAEPKRASVSRTLANFRTRYTRILQELRNPWRLGIDSKFISHRFPRLYRYPGEGRCLWKSQLLSYTKGQGST